MNNICHVTSAHQSNDTRIFYKECVSLAKNTDYRVYLVAPGEDRVEKNVHVVGVGEKPNSRIKRMSKYAKEVIRAAIEIDAEIYHLHDPELIRFAKLLKKKGKKVVFDSHEEYYDQILSKNYLPPYIRKIAANLYLQVENKACNYFDAVIATCEINGKHPYENRVTDCIYIDNLPILDIDKDKITPYEQREDAVGCIGSLAEDRGITNLIEACFNADIKLVLGGSFRPDEYREKLMTLKSFNTVDYRGFCSREDVFSIYNSVSMGASTILNVGQYYKANNLPTKVFEFMMFGLPCVLSDSEYNKRMVEKYHFGITVDPSNIDDIANAIQFLRNNKKIAKEMGENGKRLVNNEFNWASEEKKLFGLYERLLRK